MFVGSDYSRSSLGSEKVKYPQKRCMADVKVKVILHKRTYWKMARSTNWKGWNFVCQKWKLILKLKDNKCLGISSQWRFPQFVSLFFFGPIILRRFRECHLAPLKSSEGRIVNIGLARCIWDIEDLPHLNFIRSYFLGMSQSQKSLYISSKCVCLSIP